MTEKEAIKLLEKPEFGNLKHIEAENFLTKLKEVRWYIEMAIRVAPDYATLIELLAERDLRCE